MATYTCKLVNARTGREKTLYTNAPTLAKARSNIGWRLRNLPPEFHIATIEEAS